MCHRKECQYRQSIRPNLYVCTDPQEIPNLNGNVPNTPKRKTEKIQYCSRGLFMCRHFSHESEMVHLNQSAMIGDSQETNSSTLDPDRSDDIIDHCIMTRNRSDMLLIRVVTSPWLAIKGGLDIDRLRNGAGLISAL